MSKFSVSLGGQSNHLGFRPNKSVSWNFMCVLFCKFLPSNCCSFFTRKGFRDLLWLWSQSWRGGGDRQRRQGPSLQRTPVLSWPRQRLTPDHQPRACDLTLPCRAHSRSHPPEGLSPITCPGRENKERLEHGLRPHGHHSVAVWDL